VAEATLVHVFCFNRRSGEVSSMTVQDYENRKMTDLTTDIQQALSQYSTIT